MKRFLGWFGLILALLLIGGFAAGYAPDTDKEAMRAKYAYGASKFLDLAPGLSVHVRDEGKPDGRALVLIHGSNASLHTWEPWVKRLGNDYRIISLDLPGHGLTGAHPGGVYDTKTYVAVVDQVLGKLKVNRAVIGGNSMGGGVTWNYALAHPDKVEGVLLVDASGAPDAKPRNMPIGFRLARMPVVKELVRYVAPRSMFASSLKTSMSVHSVIDDALIDRYWELNRYPGNREATGKRFAMIRSNKPATKEQMAQIKAPAMIMWGEEDNLIPVSSATWFAESMPGAKLIIYPKVGHIPMEEVPDRSAADVKAWIDGLAAPTTS